MAVLRKDVRRSAGMLRLEITESKAGAQSGAHECQVTALVCAAWPATAQFAQQAMSQRPPGAAERPYGVRRRWKCR